MTALELLRVSEALGLPVSHFVHRSPAAITARRRSLEEEAQPGERIRFRTDALLEAHLRDANSLRGYGLLTPVVDVPRAVAESDSSVRELACEVRAFLGHASGPLPAMAQVSELVGLYLVITEMETDGSSLTPEPGFGAAVLGGRAPSGRRRFTAAHEIGHHILGDEYQSDVAVAAGRDERERLIDTFAGELLLPSDEFGRLWQSTAGDAWTKLVRVAAEYRISWASAVRTAQTGGVITRAEGTRLNSMTPQLGDFLAVVGAAPAEDLRSGTVGPVWTKAVLAAYTSARITRARAMEMLHGALKADEFPATRRAGSVSPKLIWDASPLVHAHRVERLDVLGDLARGPADAPWQNHTTAAMVEELAFHHGSMPEWLEVVHVDAIRELRALGSWIDRVSSDTHSKGEATVLAWAECRGAIAIIDAADARRVAQAHGLEVHGVLWVVVQAVRSAVGQWHLRAGSSSSSCRVHAIRSS